MIVTVTPNPSFDQTMQLVELTLGEIHRADAVTIEAGGKGINVARALGRAGVEATAVYPGGLADGEHLGSLLADIDGLRVAPVDVQRPIRHNTTVIEADGRSTKLNMPGDPIDAAAEEALIDAVVAHSVGASWLAVCGSLPPGVAPTFASRVRDRVGAETRVAVDASGEPLKQICKDGCDLIKPNHEELEALVGRSLPTLGDVVDTAAEVQRGGVETVLVSLGAGGALLVDSEQIVHGASPTDDVQNAVGAGDAFLAGFLAGGGSGITALSEALSWGRAAVRSPSTAFPLATDDDRAAVTISTEIDRTKQL